jgi:hypothetical protein
MFIHRSLIPGVFSLGALFQVYGLELNLKSSGGESHPESVQKILIAPDKIRLDLTTGTETHRFLYLKQKDAVFLLQPEEKAYSEISRKDLQSMGRRLDEAMNKVREQLKNLPPEQREMMEKMMTSALPQAPIPPAMPEFKKTGTEKIGTWNTVKMTGYQEKKKIAEAWVIDWKAAGFTKNDLSALKELGDFYSSVKIQAMPELNLQAQMDALDGFPVRMQNLDDGGKVIATLDVISIHPGKSPDSEFEIPAGYQKKKMDWMAGMGE